jgi:alkylation response protein AidB-like acyl-CoA dehydrogenase
MDFGLNEDQHDIQRTARELLADRANPERVREHAEAGRHDDGLWAELSELGWPGIAVAEAHGGQGLGIVELAILSEELGRTVAPVPFLPSAMAAAMIEAAGSHDQRARWLPGLASGELIGAVSAAHDGVAGMVPSAADAGVVVLVELDGVRVVARAELDVDPLHAIDPTRPAARVTATPGAGEPLPGDTEPALYRALVAVSAELVGVCSRALDMTVDYVKERKQFGTPVGAFQAVSHRCAQMLLETEIARATTAEAAWTADADPARLAQCASQAKATASDAGRSVTASAVQAHGGIGFTWEADVHWLYKRAQVDAALLGGAKEHRAHLARIVGDRGAVGAPA